MSKTLTLRTGAETAPAIRKKGRGWEISESRLDALHERAREMRRSPTPAHAALAGALAGEALGKFRPKAYAVIGSAIVNFACLPLKLVVMIDEGDVAPEIEHRRDRSLEEVGIKVVRFPAGDVLYDPAAAGQATVAAMKSRYDELRAARPARPRAPRSYQK